jgi:hypothetical protein
VTVTAGLRLARFRGWAIVKPCTGVRLGTSQQSFADEQMKDSHPLKGKLAHFFDPQQHRNSLLERFIV